MIIIDECDDDEELLMMNEEDAQHEHASTNFESRGCWTATVYA